MTPACLVCESPTDHFAAHRVLGRHDAEYRRCTKCGYVFVVAPHWLDEAYGTAIAALDTGIVVRNLWLADVTTALLGLTFRDVERTVDYGAGTGLFVRLMRDRGHDTYWHDAYSPNLLAIGFEADMSERYDLATAFELVEHLPDPRAGFETLGSLAPRLLISTDLLPDPAPAISDWPYYAPESGQHIGFFTRTALDVMAERLCRRASSNGRNLHVLAEEPVSERLLRLLRRPKRARWLARFGRRPGRTYTDADLMADRLRAAQSTSL
ncbi:class I SAM-dependent methyltransferase [Lysobacter sp. TY2-98]|uniref:class I SAM-dependent methyltransferase n=1 Tax=Lysobacter sp. TY2-98 TaxID=2290922 RepID=UPI0013B37AA0|nr:class I SAM-dependent methyltransferase [Lysobacter sp. TY2-98]